MPHTILYIEDESAIVELVHMILEHPQIRLLSASTCFEGMALARREHPDLVIADVMMPDRSGWTLYEELRADSAFNQVPVIMLTGQLHRYRIMKQFAHSPIDAYITKPFDAGTLRLQVEAMLGATLWPAPAGRRVSA